MFQFRGRLYTAEFLIYWVQSIQSCEHSMIRNGVMIIVWCFWWYL